VSRLCAEIDERVFALSNLWMARRRLLAMTG
jgi:hypothetical protein